jgi:hypothetical protein
MVHQYGRFPDVKKWMNEIGVDLERKYVEWKAAVFARHDLRLISLEG